MLLTWTLAVKRDRSDQILVYFIEKAKQKQKHKGDADRLDNGCEKRGLGSGRSRQ